MRMSEARIKAINLRILEDSRVILKNYPIKDFSDIGGASIQLDQSFTEKKLIMFKKTFGPCFHSLRKYVGRASC